MKIHFNTNRILNYIFLAAFSIILSSCFKDKNKRYGSKSNSKSKSKKDSKGKNPKIKRSEHDPNHRTFDPKITENKNTGVDKNDKENQNDNNTNKKNQKKDKKDSKFLKKDIKNKKNNTIPKSKNQKDDQSESNGNNLSDKNLINDNKPKTTDNSNSQSSDDKNEDIVVDVKSDTELTNDNKTELSDSQEPDPMDVDDEKENANNDDDESSDNSLMEDGSDNKNICCYKMPNFRLAKSKKDYYYFYIDLSNITNLNIKNTCMQYKFTKQDEEVLFGKILYASGKYPESSSDFKVVGYKKGSKLSTFIGECGKLYMRLDMNTYEANDFENLIIMMKNNPKDNESIITFTLSDF